MALLVQALIKARTFAAAVVDQSVEQIVKAPRGGSTLLKWVQIPAAVIGGRKKILASTSERRTWKKSTDWEKSLTKKAQELHVKKRSKGDSLPIHQGLSIVMITKLSRVALHCYSEITVVRGCIPFFKWDGEVVVGGLEK